MKVLIYTYDTAYQNKAGGVRNRIYRTVKALKSLGMQVDFFDKFSSIIADYDVLHIFKLDPAALMIANYAKSVGVKVVVSTIVNLKKGHLANLYWYIRKIPFATIYKQTFRLCEISSALIVESYEEASFLQKYYHVSKNKIVVIPNGADDISTKSEEIYKEIGKKINYALVVARFDNNKNQLNLIRALKGSSVNLILVGGPDPGNESYFKKCVQEAEGCENFYFLGWLDADSSLLRSVYGHAKVILCPSYQETFGLSIVEGILAGAYPVISKQLPIMGFSAMEKCITFNSDDLNDIRNSIEKAMNLETCFPGIEDVKKCFSWESVAKQHLIVYEK